MDLCFQVVVKEVLLITMQTVKTYFQLIRIRSKDSFTIHFDETFFSVNNDNKNNSDNDINNWIISCYSNGYIGDLPGVFSVWYSLDTFWRSVNL